MTNSMTTTKPQSTTEETLEPCPWCGGAAMLRDKLADGRRRDGAKLYWVMCPASLTTACRVNAKTRLCDTPEEAITIWNTRAPASAAPVVDEPHKCRKWVYSKDVMEALANAFDSMKGQTLPVSEVGYAVYKALLAVPEFTVAAATAAPVEQSDSEVEAPREIWMHVYADADCWCSYHCTQDDDPRLLTKYVREGAR